ncbi:hypothetical protein ACFUJU_15365 [Streptomyces sp. NPDC057235]|uniref:hypothetical protein n=1 Tax=Streptomyces sp. NPDC057235 TaxID=3346058 RepID=UPI00362B2681
MRRIPGIVLAVLLLGGVAAVLVTGGDGDTGTATKTVRGVVGRQLAAPREEAAGIAAALQEAEEVRQRTHTRCPEDRGRG